MFLKNAWYVAATSKELANQNIVARTLLNEPVVIFRTEGGQLSAVEDRCVHRHAPLSLGKVVGETIECGYHGARFDNRGRCVYIHGQQKIPSKAKIQGYPVTERHGFIWLWMGQSEKADEKMLPEPFAVAEEPHYRGRAGGESLLLNVDYRLLADNLFDISHAEFVHPTSFGGKKEGEYYRNARPGSEPVDRAMTYEIKERSVRFRVHVAELTAGEGGPLFPVMMAHARNMETWKDPINFTIEMTWWAPCYVTFGVRLRSLDPTDSLVVSTHKLHCAVPCTEATTNYFYRTMVSYGGEGLIDQWIAKHQKIFAEDLRFLDGQQSRLGERDVFELPNVSFNGDQLQVAARRILDRMIKADQPLKGLKEAV